MASGSTGVVVKALAANLGIAIAKFVAASISGSASMLSEAVHSLADTANQLFLLVGMRRATRQEDAIHEFGYAAERYFWGFIVAVSLFTVGATFSMYEGVHKVMHPGGGLGSRTVAYAVLAVSIGLELFSLNAAAQEFRHIKAGRSLWQTIETAPRDGTIVMGWTGTRLFIGQWFDGAAGFAGVSGALIDGARGRWIGCTHWRPLPAGPGDGA